MASPSGNQPTPGSPTDKSHRILQSMPDTRQQSFDEIYGPPENFLEIEVIAPIPLFPPSPKFEIRGERSGT